MGEVQGRAEEAFTYIARRLGCTPPTVLYWLDKHGVEIRGWGEAPEELRDEERLRQRYVDEGGACAR